MADRKDICEIDHGDDYDDKLKSLPFSQAKPQRHRCAICAYKEGKKDGYKEGLIDGRKSTKAGGKSTMRIIQSR